MRIRFGHTPIMYETPNDGGSGQGAAAVTPQVPADPAATQGQPGQQGTPNDQNFWGMFPGVPEEHRALLEPHLRQHVLPYVTRLEQNYAPFKAFTEAGISGQDAQGLLQFAQQYESSPLDTWLAMGNQLAQEGVLHEDLDLEMLGAIARGQDVPDSDFDETGQEEATLPGNLPPEVASVVQGLQQQVQQLQGQLGQFQQQTQQERQQQEQARQSQLLNQSKTQILSNLKAAGMPVNETGDPEQPGVTPDDVVAMLIVTKGNTQQAEARFLNMRNGFVKSSLESQENQPGRRELDLSNGTPPASKRGGRRGGNPNGFEGARAGAEQYLKQTLRSGDQG